MGKVVKTGPAELHWLAVAPYCWIKVAKHPVFPGTSHILASLSRDHNVLASKLKLSKLISKKIIKIVLAPDAIF